MDTIYSIIIKGWNSKRAVATYYGNSINSGSMRQAAQMASIIKTMMQSAQPIDTVFTVQAIECSDNVEGVQVGAYGVRGPEHSFMYHCQYVEHMQESEPTGDIVDQVDKFADSAVSGDGTPVPGH